jgi:hypothetical protein
MTTPISIKGASVVNLRRLCPEGGRACLGRSTACPGTVIKDGRFILTVQRESADGIGLLETGDRNDENDEELENRKVRRREAGYERSVEQRREPMTRTG